MIGVFGVVGVFWVFGERERERERERVWRVWVRRCASFRHGLHLGFEDAFAYLVPAAEP